MKNSRHFLTLLGLLLSFSIWSQDEVSKNDILSVLTNVEDLGLNNDEKGALESASSNIVDDLFSIAKSSLSPEEKTSKFKLAKDKNQKKFEDILGKDKFKKYKKKVKKELRPLRTKAKLVGFLL